MAEERDIKVCPHCCPDDADLKQVGQFSPWLPLPERDWTAASPMRSWIGSSWPTPCLYVFTQPATWPTTLSMSTGVLSQMRSTKSGEKNEPAAKEEYKE